MEQARKGRESFCLGASARVCAKCVRKQTGQLKLLERTNLQTLAKCALSSYSLCGGRVPTLSGYVGHSIEAANGTFNFVSFSFPFSFPLPPLHTSHNQEPPRADERT